MDIYETRKISETLMGIGERCSEYLLNATYLVIGTKRAALVDTGQGITGDLDKEVRKHTDLPVIVLNTHVDPDHIGSNSLFGDIHLSKLDDGLIPWARSKETRLRDLPAMTKGNTAICDYAKAHMTGDEPFEYSDIADGERFDLGGHVLEAVATPGHTRGSMCFLNRAEGYALTGDTIINFPWLWLERCTTIGEYAASVRRFKTIVRRPMAMYCGHSLEPLPPSIVDDLIAACDELVAGKKAGDIPFRVPFAVDTSGMKVMRHDHGSVHIIYDEHRSTGRFTPSTTPRRT
jgi:glyoxylase-like metal-dependent hydrolase (beta-lactamase superfamily II)